MALFLRKSEEAVMCVSGVPEKCYTRCSLGAIHLLGILPNPYLFPEVPGTRDPARMEQECCWQHEAAAPV